MRGGARTGEGEGKGGEVKGADGEGKKGMKDKSLIINQWSKITIKGALPSVIEGEKAEGGRRQQGGWDERNHGLLQLVEAINELKYQLLKTSHSFLKHFIPPKQEDNHLMLTPKDTREEKITPLPFFKIKVFWYVQE